MDYIVDVICSFTIYCRILLWHGNIIFILKAKELFFPHQESKILTVKNRASNPSFSWDVLNGKIKLKKWGSNSIA